MTEKPGEYMYLEWDFDTPYEVVRGHVSHDEATAELTEQIGEFEWVTEHCYARLIPRVGRCYDTQFVLCEKGPGAFAVTLCREPAEQAAGGESDG